MAKKENKPVNPFFSKSGGDISLAESVMSVVADSPAHAEPLEGTERRVASQVRIYLPFQDT